MKIMEPSSEDSFSQTASKLNRKVRFNSNEKFKVNLNKIKVQHRESQFIKPQELPTVSQEESDELKQSFYFRVRVISKIAVFIEKIKGLVALSNPNFKNNQMDYIESQSTSDNENKFLFNSDNIFIIIFEAILLLTSMISIWNASFLLLFPTSFLLPFHFRIIMLVLFGIEIVANLFVLPSHVLKQQHLPNYKEVILKYLKNYFFYDAVSFVSLIILQLVNKQNVILYIVKFLVILKIVTILRVVNKFQGMYVTTPEAESKISIIKLITKILTFVHFLSLTLNLLNQVQIHNGIQNTWLRQYGMADSTALQMYLCGWYWGATILTTVGFGDITPANIYQAFTISLIQILCCAIFGYSINYIGGLIGVLGESTQIFQKQMRRVNKYLENLDVNRGLKDEIRQHFYNKQKIKKIHDPAVQSIVMDNIPIPLKSQVLEMNNKNFLQKTNFFKRYNDSILNPLAMKLKKIIYSPDQVVFNKGDSNSKIFILEKGNINEFYNNEPNNMEKIIAQYNPTTVQPGYINFITGEPFTTYSRSSGFSWTYQLSREDMLSVLIQFKAEYYKFCQLKDRLIQKGKKFVSRCCACLKLSHNALQCPKIHFQAKIKIFKFAASRSRIKANSRHFYPRTSQKYKSLGLFSCMIQEDSVSNSSNLNPNNNRRMSVEENSIVINNNRQSRRMSAVLIERLPKLPPIVPAYMNQQKNERQRQKQKQKQRQNVNSLQMIRIPEVGGQDQFRLWFDVGKFDETENYFPESYVKEIVNEYNVFLRRNKDVKQRKSI